MVSISTTESKYITHRHIFRKIIWKKRFINKMNFEVIEKVTMHGDNEISIALTKNTQSQYQTKYIDV